LAAMSLVAAVPTSFPDSPSSVSVCPVSRSEMMSCSERVGALVRRYSKSSSVPSRCRVMS